MSKLFNRVAGLKPGRSVFDLSHTKLFDCDIGQLIPVLCMEAVPGDYFKIGNEIIVRLQPLVAPVLHEIDVTVHYFYVPYRLLWNDSATDNWEQFITGGEDGANAAALPRWKPGVVPSKGSLWDYMGFPLVNPVGLDAPLPFPYRAYVFIYNEYYRDENLIPRDTNHLTAGTSPGVIRKRSWRKDYFTSALPWQQRGTAPALPVVGSAVWASGLFQNVGGGIAVTVPNDDADNKAYLTTPGGLGAFKNHENANTLAATSVTMEAFRLTAQIQKWLERNARGGVRYTEFLQAHFGVHPKDDRLDRPEYIGGTKQPIIVSEVLKTAQDGSRPQGNLAGHGLSASEGYAGGYHVQEFGLIMGILSIMPKGIYNSQGFNRQWLRRSKYDFYFPEFAHLSEQAIEKEELYATSVESANRQIFGYQGRYDELRVMGSGTMNNMRDTLNYWHMARTFGAAPALNQAFLEVDGSEAGGLRRIFAVTSEPGYIVHIGNRVVANRPMPMIAEPGMADHF